MKQLVVLVLLLVTINSSFSQSFGEYPPFTKWYQNPLGFSPLKLHTSNAIILPALAAGVILLLTKNDASLKNKISYYNETGYSKGYYGNYTNMLESNFGVLFNLRKYLSLGAEFTTYYAFDEKNNTAGFGVRPFARFYPVNNDKLKLYFESGAGIAGFTEKFPQPSGFFGDNRTGTNFNGNPKYGIGASYKINNKFDLNLAVKHFHISNGNTAGEENNPGHDGNGFTLGITYNPMR